MKKFRAGNKAFSEKVNKYKHALEQGLGFLPIIFETTGQMHHETLLFFVTCLEQASRVRQIPFTVLWKYWMFTLVFTLQRSMAQGIIGRSSEIFRQRFKETYETSRGCAGVWLHEHHVIM